MDSRSLFLTANADTVYFVSFLDLPNGPLVVVTPADTLGIVDDMWFGWITDFGLPGADRGQGGTYVLLPPGYEGTSARGGGHYVRHSSHQPRASARPGLHRPERGPRPRPHR